MITIEIDETNDYFSDKDRVAKIREMARIASDWMNAADMYTQERQIRDSNGGLIMKLSAPLEIFKE